MKLKVTTLIGSLGISFVMFLGLMYSEIDHFNKFNPPADKVEFTLNQNFKTDLKNKVFGLTSYYQYGVLFEDSEADFTQIVTQMKSGLLYMNGELNPLNPTKKEHNLLTKPFDTENIQNKNGWILVGDLKMGVYYGTGDVLIERKAVKKTTDIHALSHPVEVWMNGMVQPFVIPPENKIRVEDYKINKNTAQLFYSKLRKKSELNLSSFSLNNFSSTETAMPSLESYSDKVL